MPLSRSGPMTGCIVECTITSTPCASFSTCADVDVGRGGAGRSLPASPPITTLPAGVSTRYEAWPAIWVERIALTLTSPFDQTSCGLISGIERDQMTEFGGAADTPAFVLGDALRDLT